MADKWSVRTLEQIKAKQDGAIAIGPFGSRMKADRYVPSGVPVIRGTNISDTRGFAGEFVFVSEATADELRSSNVFPGDLVFPHRGAIGQVGIVPWGAAARYVLSTSLMKISCNRDVVDPLFVFYFFRSRHGRNALLQHASTVGTPGIGQPLASLRSIAIPLPSLSEQGAIAHILGTLDDKIEVNQRIGDTLEATARALFKSWFVDFDPVRARAEGRTPRLPTAVADLFPDSMVKSEGRAIPKGWALGALGDVAEHPRRTIQANRLMPASPYIALEHMPRHSISLRAWGVADGLESNKFEFKRGEILFGKLRPYFHKVGLAPVDGVCSTDIVVARPTTPEWFGFVLGHMSSTEFVDYTNAGSTGTKMPRTDWAEMSRYPVVLPPPTVAATFTRLIQPGAERILTGIHESRTLGEVRDALLPKLVSGLLRVKDAERLISKAVA